jgi:hypothetical protein
MTKVCEMLPYFEGPNVVEEQKEFWGLLCNPRDRCIHIVKGGT